MKDVSQHLNDANARKRITAEGGDGNVPSELNSARRVPFLLCCFSQGEQGPESPRGLVKSPDCWTPPQSLICSVWNGDWASASLTSSPPVLLDLGSQVEIHCSRPKGSVLCLLDCPKPYIPVSLGKLPGSSLLPPFPNNHHHHSSS